MTAQYMDTAKQIVDLGINDPDLFVLMALFEEGVGPDRISDMTTNVILKDLLKFNERILPELGVPTRPIKIKTYAGNLPFNPYMSKNGYVILVPTDILRKLPIVNDWSDIESAIAHNAELRSKANHHILQIWREHAKNKNRNKNTFRKEILSNKHALESSLNILQIIARRAGPYDFSADLDGEVSWLRYMKIAEQEPCKILAPLKIDLASAKEIVEKIIDKFRFLIEERRLSEELYNNGQPRHERSAQRLFFAIANSYCEANNLDLTPEADTGAGPVDFKVSHGANILILVEIKLSSNRKLVHGYTKQLDAYKTAEGTMSAFYVVVDVGNMGKKDERLIKSKNKANAQGEITSSIYFIDGKRRPSASNL